MRPQPKETSPWNVSEDGLQSRGLRSQNWCVPHGRRLESRSQPLTRVIELEIVPRLVLSQRVEPVAPVAALPLRDTGFIEEFARLVLVGEEARICDCLDLARARGSTIEAIYLDLLSATARRMGELWDQDLVHFGDVTVGLIRLQRILRDYGDAFQNEVPHRDQGYRALIVSTPGEQHSFGLSMVGEFFHRAGWGVSGGPGMTLDDMLRQVHHDSFAMIGISLSCETKLELLARCIGRLRGASRNRAPVVLVGGRLFSDHPELVAQVGADGTAGDAMQAVATAEAMIAQVRRGG